MGGGQRWVAEGSLGQEKERRDVKESHGRGLHERQAEGQDLLRWRPEECMSGGESKSGRA